MLQVSKDVHFGITRHCNLYLLYKLIGRLCPDFFTSFPEKSLPAPFPTLQYIKKYWSTVYWSEIALQVETFYSDNLPPIGSGPLGLYVHYAQVQDLNFQTEEEEEVVLHMLPLFCWNVSKPIRASKIEAFRKSLCEVIELGSINPDNLLQQDFVHYCPFAFVSNRYRDPIPLGLICLELLSHNSDLECVHKEVLHNALDYFLNLILWNEDEQDETGTNIIEEYDLDLETMVGVLANCEPTNFNDMLLVVKACYWEPIISSLIPVSLVQNSLFLKIKKEMIKLMGKEP